MAIEGRRVVRGDGMDDLPSPPEDHEPCAQGTGSGAEGAGPRADGANVLNAVLAARPLTAPSGAHGRRAGLPGARNRITKKLLKPCYLTRYLDLAPRIESRRAQRDARTEVLQRCARALRPVTRIKGGDDE